MNISPATNGGRLIQGDTLYGKFDIYFSEEASGSHFDIVINGEVVGGGTFEHRDPPKSGKQLGPNWPLKCSHRGEKVADIDCASCSGTVKLKVFACGIHETCTIKKPMEGHQACTTCKDYTEESQ